MTKMLAFSACFQPNSSASARTTTTQLKVRLKPSCIAIRTHTPRYVHCSSSLIFCVMLDEFLPLSTIVVRDVHQNRDQRCRPLDPSLPGVSRQVGSEGRQPCSNTSRCAQEYYHSVRCDCRWKLPRLEAVGYYPEHGWRAGSR